MGAVGVRQLKAQTSEVLRRVQKGETIDVTHRGRVVARMVPVGGSSSVPEEVAAVWADLDQLAAEIGARWPTGVTAAEAVQEERREL